jgi:hypothetical protein
MRSLSGGPDSGLLALLLLRFGHLGLNRAGEAGTASQPEDVIDRVGFAPPIRAYPVTRRRQIPIEPAAPSVLHPLRFRALALFRRRLSERGDRDGFSVMVISGLSRGFSTWFDRDGRRGCFASKNG